VRYVEDATINEVMLFYTHTNIRATSKYFVFEIVDDFIIERITKRSDRVGASTSMNAASVVAGNKRLHIKSYEYVDTMRVIYCDSLFMKELYPELRKLCIQ
jgi:hypothetical protein